MYFRGKMRKKRQKIFGTPKIGCLGCGNCGNFVKQLIINILKYFLLTQSIIIIATLPQTLPQPLSLPQIATQLPHRVLLLTL